MPKRAFAVLLLSATGCGPLFSPMVPRLKPEQQHSVDQMWNNMLSPPQRLSRQTLLDTTVAYWMYVYGVDRLHMTSEKYVAGGSAVMEMDCDRANPDADQFTITLLDQQRHTLRRERYSRAEVEESSRALRGMPNAYPVIVQAQVNVSVGPATQSAQPAQPQPAQPQPAEVETPQERAWRREAERRWAAVAAATQPAAGVRGQ